MFKLGEDSLTCGELYSLAMDNGLRVELTKDSIDRVRKYRDLVETAVSSGKTIYGINTGFGYLSNVRIADDKLSELQVNLIRSHACGVGNFVDYRIVKALMILRLHTFCLGSSGISLETIKTILAFLKAEIYPVIPSQGSVGASGDLAPLAHLALGLMGEGKVHYQGAVRDCSEVLRLCSIEPISPGPKEGLSLINGTHFMTVVAAFAVAEARALVVSSDIICALSIDALRGSVAQFDRRIHAVRPHKGQAIVARNMLALFANEDEIMKSHVDCDKVQDPYSLRCVPQVHGAVRDTLAHVQMVVDTELNSVTDNPLCFDDGAVISGGNFHGQPIAMVMDFLGIAISELGSISERRVEKLTNPALSGLPAFIIKDGGLNSGFMIPHVVAAALASENKVLSHPASVDSIPTSADKEDHVSMGPISARKAREINQNVASVLAIELLCACQGIDMLDPLKPNMILDSVYRFVRNKSPRVDRDRSLSQDIEVVKKSILAGEIASLVLNQHISLE